MTIPSYAQERIMAFLNKAQTIEEIIDPAVLKDHDGSGYTIGEEVAGRILETRHNLQFKRFTSFAQLEGISGLGPDKLQDLAFSISPPAAAAFRDRMYANLIRDNWELTPHTTFFKDGNAFLTLANTPSLFTEWVADQVEKLSLDRNNNREAAFLAKQLVKRSWLETWDVSHYGAIALGFWFYRFDADNWFSFDRVREEAEFYLDYYPRIEHRLELRFFKGFPNGGVLVSAITSEDLPVVVNFGEQEITIWTAQLND